MSSAGDLGRGRRIVAIFGGEADTSVAGLLASLASDGPIDVAGVFLEEHSLYRLAELPFSAEVCRITAVYRPLVKSDLERQMRVLAARAERLVRQVAEQAGSRWTFTKHRGRLSTALAEDAQVDLVLIGAARKFLASFGDLYETAQPARAVGRDAIRPIAVLLDHPEAASRTLDSGIELAERTGRAIIVFVPNSPEQTLPDLQTRLQRLGPRRAAARSVPSADSAALLAAIRRASPAAVVAAAGESGFEEKRVGELQRFLRCPLVMVR